MHDNNDAAGGFPEEKCGIIEEPNEEQQSKKAKPAKDPKETEGQSK
jgi:hypothetical protein